MNCDVRNSRPRPDSEWFNPAGQSVSTQLLYRLPGIMRDQSGVYTCVVTESGVSANSSVDVTVQCECVFAEERLVVVKFMHSKITIHSKSVTMTILCGSVCVAANNQRRRWN